VQLAYVNSVSGNDEIYVDAKNLTNNAATDTTPAWSPDGSKIAFVSNRSGAFNIWVMNADGSEPTQLTNQSGADAEPAWSPDGSKIVFSSQRDSASGEIYVMNADGSSPTRLTQNTAIDRTPAWSPDSSQIVFRSSINGNGLYLMNADGSNLTRLTSNFDDRPSWKSRPPRRFLIGASGRMGTRARGLVFTSHDAAQTGGVATFDSDADYTAFAITFPNDLNANLNLMGAEIKARDNATPITRLDYWSRTLNAPVRVTWTGTMVGAVVQSSMLTGNIVAVAPFGASGRAAPIAVRDQAGVRTLRGNFLGAWDANGKNLAPFGASEIRIALQSGRILAAR
jgi:dipeptidyl aminopeptidase/acylaminoacyl peptidase